MWICGKLQWLWWAFILKMKLLKPEKKTVELIFAAYQFHCRNANYIQISTSWMIILCIRWLKLHCGYFPSDPFHSRYLTWTISLKYKRCDQFWNAKMHCLKIAHVGDCEENLSRKYMESFIIFYILQEIFINNPSPARCGRCVGVVFHSKVL